MLEVRSSIKKALSGFEALDRILSGWAASEMGCVPGVAEIEFPCGWLRRGGRDFSNDINETIDLPISR